MKQTIKNKLPKENGITLVALVVTIVVLLILAGVSINMVLGNNGLIAKAKDAKTKTEQDQVNTEKGMNNLYDEITSILGENPDGGSGDTGNGDGNGDILPSTEGTTPWLPENYTPVSGTDLDTGLVIQDELGNEYVWIEVPNDGTGPDYTAVANSKDYTNIENALKAYTNYYRNGTSNTDTYYSDATTGLTSTEYTTYKNAMLKSVYENGGFYIGKYEAGIATNRTSSEDTIADNLKPLSKANQYPLTYVTCSQAQMLAERVAPTGYNSSLMFGVQWDLVLKYLEVKAVAKGTEVETIREELSGTITGSTSWGNYADATFGVTNTNAKYAIYSQSTWLLGNWNTISESYTKPNTGKENMVILTTGANETRNSKMNICDLAGNVWEWTLEYTSYSSSPCAYRGGNYFFFGSNNPASNRYNYGTTISDNDVIGFRLSLY